MKANRVNTKIMRSDDPLTRTMTMHIEIDITDQERIEMPPWPRNAALGDDFISLENGDQLSDVGHWLIHPESVTMKLLRLAWLAAHQEHADEIQKKAGGH